MKDAVGEARRYLDNAREILREKAGNTDGYYKDKKYVKMAGHTAYSGVLVALDSFLNVKKKGRKSVEWYQQELLSADKKIRDRFNSAYEILHIFMGYDGVSNSKVVKEGLHEAEEIINWIDIRTSVKD